MPPNSVVPSRPGRLGKRHARPGRTEGRFPVSSERQIARFEDDSTVASALERSEERYEILASVANDGIWDWDLSTNRIAFSDRWKQLLGYEGDEITDNPNEWFVRVHPQDAEQIQLEISAHLDGSRELFESRHRMLHKNGTYRLMHLRGRATRNFKGNALRLVGSLTDTTERHNAESELIRRAFYDSLTALPNRALFMDHLWRVLENARRRNQFTFAVLFIDLDRFKIINDSLGHHAGDELLVEIAKRLGKSMRQTDSLARLGGDEFAVLLEQVPGPEEACLIADRIQDEFAHPFELDGHTAFSSASIGIAMGCSRYIEPEELLRDADVAMYKAKAAGKARYELYDAAMHEQAVRLLHLETDLRGAVARDEFVVHYQPIVSLPDGRLTGFESLVRWQHPTRGLVSPGDFIPIAEETDLIVQIDRWVLRKACEQMVAWRDILPAGDNLSVSVNLSSKQFMRSDLVDYIARVLAETGMDPAMLKLEITESAVMANPNSAAVILGRLKAMGHELMIDDFGTGYSSLNYLHSFPIDRLKIDRYFISKLDSESGMDLEITRTIVTLAHNLGLTVVAEGVETADQLGTLNSLGCEYCQGYYFSKPLPAESVEVAYSTLHSELFDAIAVAMPVEAATPSASALRFVSFDTMSLESLSVPTTLIHESIPPSIRPNAGPGSTSAQVKATPFSLSLDAPSIHAPPLSVHALREERRRRDSSCDQTVSRGRRRSDRAGVIRATRWSA